MENYRKDSKTAAVIIIIMTAAVVVSWAVTVPLADVRQLFLLDLWIAYISPAVLL